VANRDPVNAEAELSDLLRENARLRELVELAEARAQALVSFVKWALARIAKEYVSGEDAVRVREIRAVLAELASAPHADADGTE